MRIKVLDGLRGYAVLMILLAHFPIVQGIPDAVYLIIEGTKLGYLGVDIFFVLSGFLITRILIREKEVDQFSFIRFYIKRIIRIFPIYYLVIVVSAVLFTWDGFIEVSLFWANYYFSFDLSPHPLRHTWSLSVEEHYYFTWPLIVYFCSLKHLKKWLLWTVMIVVCVAIPLVFYTYDEGVANNLIYRGTQFRILSLGIGSTFAFYEKELQALTERHWGKVLLSLLIVVVFTFMIETYISMPFEYGILLILYSIISSIVFLIAFKHEKKAGTMKFILTNVSIRFIGKISYGIYLFHFPILYFFQMTPNQLKGESIAFEMIIVPLVLIFLLPVISFYTIERPLQNNRQTILQRFSK